MTSPFARRASEQIPLIGHFLAHVAPAPLETYFQSYGEDGTLYDRLVVITGAPGSGKTTLARLFQFSHLSHLQRQGDIVALSELCAQMTDCHAIEFDFPAIAGTRLSMEINYRDFWECPYEAAVKHGLMQALISARAVLGWAREFTEAGFNLADIRARFKPDAGAAGEAVGGESLLDMVKVATQVEHATYHVATALIPPRVEDLPALLSRGYKPLEVLKAFVVLIGTKEMEVRPLVMLDDMHALHVEQRNNAIRWLVRRDIGIARWVLWRFDALDPGHVLYEQGLVAQIGTSDGEPGVQVGRDITEIRLQHAKDRKTARRQFRRMAQQIGKRYLNQMDVFRSEGVESLEEMLEKRMSDITQTVMDRVSARKQTAIRRANLPVSVITQLETETQEYLAKHELEVNEAAVLKDAMLSILIARTVRRTPQATLFGEGNALDVEDGATTAATDDEDENNDGVAKPKPGVEHGARLQLARTFDLPFYYGPDALYDAGSENAEQFLQMADPMVDLLRVKTIRRRPRRTLTAKEQDIALKGEASKIVRNWNFPESQSVRLLAEGIAQECVDRSMLENAPLGAGASAVGIPMEDFNKIGDEQPDLARILQFGVAYNVFSIIRDYGTKRKKWCLIELGGAMLIKNGLTFQRGGFVEKRLHHILGYLQGGVA